MYRKEHVMETRAVEKGGKGVSYPGPRSVGGAPAIPQNDFSVGMYGEYKS